MTLSRLTHERYARLKDRGAFPDDLPVEPVETAPEPAIPRRGGEPRHPTWHRIMALVRQDKVVNWDFVAEARTCSEAIQIASRYPYRALVFDCHGKREYDNGRSMEIEP